MCGIGRFQCLVPGWLGVLNGLTHAEYSDQAGPCGTLCWGGGGGYHQHHDLPGHTYPWPHTVSQFGARQFPGSPRFHTTQNSGAGISGLLFQPLFKERTNTWGGATFLLLPAGTTKVSQVEGYLQRHRGHGGRARISILQDSSPLPLQGQR